MGINLQELDALDVSEKMALISHLWDSLQPEDIRVSEEHKRIIRERYKEFQKDPGRGESWEHVKAEILND